MTSADLLVPLTQRARDRSPIHQLRRAGTAWERGAEGVERYTQDGTDSFDDPYVNGIPDYEARYSAGCSALLEHFPWLAHEPGGESIGPRYRTDWR